MAEPAAPAADHADSFPGAAPGRQQPSQLDEAMTVTHFQSTAAMMTLSHQSGLISVLGAAHQWAHTMEEREARMQQLATRLCAPLAQQCPLGPPRGGLHEGQPP